MGGHQEIDLIVISGRLRFRATESSRFDNQRKLMYHIR
jgi:hypothetical protein